MTTFEDAKVGDRVWSITNRRWGKIIAINPNHTYQVYVEFGEDLSNAYTFKGQSFTRSQQVLFWDEVKFEAPEKPMPKLEVDTKVRVWGSDSTQKIKRYFSHFDQDGDVCCFNDGATSWTHKHFTAWDNWELADE